MSLNVGLNLLLNSILSGQVFSSFFYKLFSKKLFSEHLPMTTGSLNSLTSLVLTSLCNKVTDLKSCNFIKNSKCFSVNVAKFLKELRNCILRIILVFIIFFNTGLCRSVFSTISFRKLVIYLSAFPVFFALSHMFWTRILKNMCYHDLKCLIGM